MQRLVLRLTGRFLRQGAWAILSMSRAITRQVDELTGGTAWPDVRIAAGLSPGVVCRTFRRLRPNRTPFHVLYVGRIEADKGVFAGTGVGPPVRRGRPDRYRVRPVRGRRALEELRKKASELGSNRGSGLMAIASRAKLQEMYSAAHVVIVPTTAQFTEGFNQVMTEAVLSGRPVVTSDACPAVEYLPNTGVIVPTDDTDAYEKAVLRLCDDPAFYEAARANCAL